MKIGIIDIGSNTIKGFIYEMDSLKIHAADKKYVYAHLMSYIKNDELTQEGLHILLDAAGRLKNFCESFTCDKIYAFATSAVRSAKNAGEIKTIFKDNLGMDLDILPEESEAYYDYTSLHFFAKKQSGIGVDLGGGSAQIVIFDEEGLHECVSLPIGALRMKNDFVSGVFPSQMEFDAIKKHIQDLIRQSLITPLSFERIYLIGGTAITVLSLMRAAIMPVKNKIQLAYLFQIKENIEAMGDEKSIFLQKYAKGRESSILPGIAVLQGIGEYFACNEFKVMKCGVREGYLIEKIGEIKI